MSITTDLSTNGHAVADVAHMDLLQGVTFDPVFILGSARSGTTFLYELLQETGHFNVVEIYHLRCYDELLANHLSDGEEEARRKLDDHIASMGITDRVIDSVKVSSTSPVEYLFRFWADAGRLLVSRQRLMLTKNNAHDFSNLCKKIQFVSPGDRLMLLKSPLDFANFVTIRSLYPNARFLFIHRHPAHVLNSQLKAIRSWLTTYNRPLSLVAPQYQRLFHNRFLRSITKWVYTSPFAPGLRLLARYLASTSSYYAQHAEDLPPSACLSLRYEDLCENPEHEVQRILDFLQLPSMDLSSLSGRVNRREVTLLPEVARQYDRTSRKLRTYLEKHNYSAP